MSTLEPCVTLTCWRVILWALGQRDSALLVGRAGCAPATPVLKAVHTRWARVRVAHLPRNTRTYCEGWGLLGLLGLLKSPVNWEPRRYRQSMGLSAKETPKKIHVAGTPSLMALLRA